MGRNPAVIVFAIVLVCGLTACQKIDTNAAGAAGSGPLVLELSASGDAIPVGYGELVGITPDAANPWQAVLWFEGPDRTVTAVWVNTGKRRVVASLAIPRR